LKCLAKSPDHRYATGDDLRVDLLRFREGRAVEAGVHQTGQHPSVGTTQSIQAVGGTQALPAIGSDDHEVERQANRTPLYATILALLLVALAVVIIFLGNSVGWWHLGSTPRSFAMPDVTNQNVTQAERTLQHDGLKTKVQTDALAKTTPNTQVIRTDPGQGTAVQRGQKVTLVTGSQGPPVHVLNEVGQSVGAAKSQLQQMGLQANVQSSSSCTQQDIVCNQNPKAGQTLPPGGTVTIFTAPTTSPVPDVSGLQQTTACNRLGQAGFQCGTITTQPSQTVLKNSVISMNPAAGTQEPANTNVNLVVSSGPSTVLVPDVVTNSEAQAVATLQSAGLNPVVICQATLDQAQDGLVQSQSPAGGISVSAGTTVDITVASFSGCSGTTTTSPTTTTVAPPG
jgi:beta-lactam-binding protein with PASTA domain